MASETKPTNYYLHTLSEDGAKVTCAVQEGNDPAILGYAVGDRLWAAPDYSRRPVSGTVALVEVTRIGHRYKRKERAVYDEDEAPLIGRPMEGFGGVAAGEVETHYAEYGVRILRTEPAPGYESLFAPSDRTYPSLAD
jgi:hypothetical protein